VNKSEPPIEENLALAANTKKGRGRWFPAQKNKGKRPKPNRETRQIDMSKIGCYDC
jgi:hypothetical protein